MSVISNTSLGGGFPVANGVFDLERSPGNALARSLGPIDFGSDAVRIGPPYANPIVLPPGGVPGSGAPTNGLGFGGGGLGGIFQSLMGELASLFQQLAQLMGFASTAGGATTDPGVAGQQAFKNATASSTGDPHESFDGTRGDGRQNSGKWDSMTAHQNLLSSDSFDGGFRLSNTVTQPSPSGVTMNAHVGVATDGGQTNVGMNGDGSYDVTSFGRHVDLVQGQAVRLNENESVTLNADKSLTVTETNTRGGSIATTLRSNGGGVDVSNEAHNVDLGGYLVTKNDGDGDPVASASPRYGAQSGGFDGSYNGVEPIYSGVSAYPDDALRTPRTSQLAYADESFEPDVA